MSNPCIAQPLKPTLCLAVPIPLRSKLLRLYEECQAVYTAEGVSQANQLLLRRIARMETIEGEMGREEAAKVVAALAKEMIMNDLEIVGWSIYIGRLGGSGGSEQVLNLLTFAGVAAKYYFDDNIGMLQAHFEKTRPNFTKNYNEWFRTHSHLMHISPKELNDRFKHLTATDMPFKPRPPVDYNSLVDGILESTPLHLHLEPQETFPIVPVPLKMEAVLPAKSAGKVSSGDEPELPEFTYQWSIGLSLEKLGSLTELWPDQPQRKRQDEFTEARLGHE